MNTFPVRGFPRCRLSWVPALLVLFEAAVWGMSGSKARKRAEELLSFVPETAASYSPDATITGEEVKRYIRPQLVRMVESEQEISTPELHRWARTLLDSMIRHRLLVDAAAQAGHSPDRNEGKQKVAEIKARLGRSGFRETLEAQATSESDLILRMAELAAVNAWINDVVVPETRMTSTAVEDYYRSHADEFRTQPMRSAWHILISVPKDASAKDREAARKKVESILEELQHQGTPLSDLAARYSDCPSSRNGGFLGYFAAGRMVEAFEKALHDLEKDEISPVVETTYGFHIIKAGQTVAARWQSFDEVKGEIVRKLSDQSIQSRLERIADRLMEERKVKIFLEPE